MYHFYGAPGVFKPEFRVMYKRQGLGCNPHTCHWHLIRIQVSISAFFPLPLCHHRLFFLYIFRVSFSSFFFYTPFFTVLLSTSFTFISCLSDLHIASKVGLCYHKTYKQLRVPFANYTFNRHSKPEMGG